MLAGSVPASSWIISVLRTATYRLALANPRDVDKQATGPAVNIIYPLRHRAFDIARCHKFLRNQVQAIVHTGDHTDSLRVRIGLMSGSSALLGVL